MNASTAERLTGRCGGRSDIADRQRLEGGTQSPLQRARTITAEMSESAVGAHCRDTSAALEAAGQDSLQTGLVQFEAQAKLDAEPKFVD